MEDYLSRWHDFIATGYFDKYPRAKHFMSSCCYQVLDSIVVEVPTSVQKVWLEENMVDDINRDFAAFVGKEVAVLVQVHGGEAQQPTLFDEPQPRKSEGRTSITYGDRRTRTKPKKEPYFSLKDWEIIILLVFTSLITALFIFAVQQHNRDVKNGRYDYLNEVVVE